MNKRYVPIVLLLAFLITGNGFSQYVSGPSIPWALIDSLIVRTRVEYPNGMSIGRGATFTVAASNATDYDKSQADWVCDGIEDEEEIQAANDSIASLGGGSLRFTAGTFVPYAAVNCSSWVHFSGTGGGTLFNTDSAIHIFTGSGVSNCFIGNIRFIGPGTTDNSSAVYFYRSDNIRIENLYLLLNLIQCIFINLVTTGYYNHIRPFKRTQRFPQQTCRQHLFVTKRTSRIYCYDINISS